MTQGLMSCFLERSGPLPLPPKIFESLFEWNHHKWRFSNILMKQILEIKAFAGFRMMHPLDRMMFVTKDLPMYTVHHHKTSGLFYWILVVFNGFQRMHPSDQMMFVTKGSPMSNPDWSFFLNSTYLCVHYLSDIVWDPILTWPTLPANWMEKLQHDQTMI